MNHFDRWEPDKEYAIGEKVRHDNIVYRVIEANHTSSQDTQPGTMPGYRLYRPVSVINPETGNYYKGTEEDPIPYITGMDVRRHKIYLYQDELFTPAESYVPCEYSPAHNGYWIKVYGILPKETGTQDNPIALDYNTDVHVGKFYKYGDKVYRANINQLPCALLPDSYLPWSVIKEKQ